MHRKYIFDSCESLQCFDFNIEASTKAFLNLEFITLIQDWVFGFSTAQAFALFQQ